MHQRRRHLDRAWKPPRWQAKKKMQPDNLDHTTTLTYRNAYLRRPFTHGLLAKNIQRDVFDIGSQLPPQHRYSQPHRLGRHRVSPKTRRGPIGPPTSMKGIARLSSRTRSCLDNAIVPTLAVHTLLVHGLCWCWPCKNRPYVRDAFALFEKISPFCQTQLPDGQPCLTMPLPRTRLRRIFLPLLLLDTSQAPSMTLHHWIVSKKTPHTQKPVPWAFGQSPREFHFRRQSAHRSTSNQRGVYVLAEALPSAA